MKSPRFELVLFAALLISAMAAFVWMQHWSIKSKASKSGAAIQDGKTIDFSSNRPIVKDDAKQKARATFSPAAPNENKKVEPVPASPKP